MAYDPPHTISSGELVGLDTMNGEWGGNIAFLANPPACRVYNSSAESIADHTLVTVTFNSERYDTDTMHSTSVNAGRITVKTAGLYVVSFSGEMAAANDYTYVGALLILNGVTYIASHFTRSDGGVAPPRFTVTTTYKFAVNDYVEVHIWQDNAANTARHLNASGNYSPEFSATWIGLG